MSESSSNTQQFLKGIPVPIQTGMSLREFLCIQLGLDQEYVERRITTIFLDGRVVDTLDDTVLADGAELALSAAMPGLAGAALRRNGAYASLRSAISQDAYLLGQDQAVKQGVIYVKLFNLLIKELGPVILSHALSPKRNDL